jgi:hypothetical protein
MKIALTFIAGAVCATGLVLACSDDSPHDADAATCDCPAAEPPLAGRITKVRGLDGTLAQSSAGGAVAVCPAGSTLLSGSCHLVEDGGGATSARLLEGGPDEVNPNGWGCAWRNGPEFTATVHAEVRCLLPPP